MIQKLALKYFYHDLLLLIVPSNFYVLGCTFMFLFRVGWRCDLVLFD